MANLPKNGYSFTGYTEPFFTSVPVTTSTDLSTVDYDGMGQGIVAIENTIFKGSKTYCVVKGNQTGDTITTSYNTLRPDDVISDDGGTTFFTVLSVRTLPIVDIVDNVQNNIPEQEIVFDGAVDVTSGDVLRVLGRVVDVGSVTATKNYVAGEKVLEIYPPVGSYTL